MKHSFDSIFHILIVFHVTDQQGNKVTDSKTIDYIEKVCNKNL